MAARKPTKPTPKAKVTAAATPPRSTDAPKKRKLARMRASSREIWYRPTITGWTPKRVENARDQAESGIMQELSDLIETMFRDARISGVLGTRTHGMLGLPLEFVGGSDPARDELSATRGQQDTTFWQMHDESELAKLLRWGLMLGVGVAQRIPLPRIIGQPQKYRLETWASRWLQYRHYEDGGRWKIQTQDGMEDVIPGDGKWILFMPYGRRRPWGEGLWQQLAFPWLLKHFSMEDRANFGEVLGSPIWVGSTARGGTEKQRNAFLAQLMSLGKNGKIVLPKDWDLQLREASASGKSGDVFDQQIQTSNEEITIALAGQLVTTEGTTGFSAGNVQENIHQNLLRFDALRLANCLRDQSLAQWALENYGTRVAAPWPKWLTEKPEDITEAADGLQKLGDAITALDASLAAHGLQVDVMKLLEKFNVPTLKRDASAPLVPNA